MSDKRRSELPEATQTTTPASQPHAVIGFASALALLIDRLEAAGSLPAGDFQAVLRSTLAHPSISSESPDAAVLHTLLELLEATGVRPALRVLPGRGGSV